MAPFECMNCGVLRESDGWDSCQDELGRSCKRAVAIEVDTVLRAEGLVHRFYFSDEPSIGYSEMAAMNRLADLGHSVAQCRSLLTRATKTGALRLPRTS